MSQPPEPPSVLSVLNPTLPTVPDRLRRARWLAAGDADITQTFTSLTSTSQIFPGTSGAVE